MPSDPDPLAHLDFSPEVENAPCQHCIDQRQQKLDRMSPAARTTFHYLMLRAYELDSTLNHDTLTQAIDDAFDLALFYPDAYQDLGLDLEALNDELGDEESEL